MTDVIATVPARRPISPQPDNLVPGLSSKATRALHHSLMCDRYYRRNGGGVPWNDEQEDKIHAEALRRFRDKAMAEARSNCAARAENANC